MCRANKNFTRGGFISDIVVGYRSLKSRVVSSGFHFWSDASHWLRAHLSTSPVCRPETTRNAAGRVRTPAKGWQRGFWHQTCCGVGPQLRVQGSKSSGSRSKGEGTRAWELSQADSLYTQFLSGICISPNLYHEHWPAALAEITQHCVVIAL